MQIDKQTMLSEINLEIIGGKPHIFSIGFIRVSPLGRGTFALVKKAKILKSSDKIRGKRREPGPKKRVEGNRKLGGRLKLYDIENEQPFDVLIDTIKRFNGMEVIHYRGNMNRR